MKENDENDKIVPLAAQDPSKDNLIELDNIGKTSMKKPGCCSSVFNIIFPCFRKVDTKTRRLVLFRNSPDNVTYWSNKEENHKYSILFFLPIVLFNQFRQFGNFFYLLLSISQFFPQFVVGFLFTYISPLCIVVFVSMSKELYDDIKRRIQDKKTNATLITTLLLDKSNWKVKRIQKKAACC